MESAEALPAPIVDTSDLENLVQRRGPFLSVELLTEGAVERAARRVEQRWRALRADLATTGTPEAVLASVDAVVPGAHQHGDCLAVVATDEGVGLVAHGPAPRGEDLSSWGPVPRLQTVLAWRQAAPPHVVVVADRTGADLFAFRYGERDRSERVTGDHDVIRKVASGGWSQHRYQERAEDSWERNADQVASAVTELFEQTDPRLVVALGDVREVHLVARALPKSVAERLRIVEREPRRDGRPTEVPDDVHELVDDLVRDETGRLLEKWREEIGQADRAREGVAPTALALARAQVEALLLADVPGDHRTVWVGPEPQLVSTDEGALRLLGIASPTRAPARDALVCAAVGTGAGVRMLDPEAAGLPRDGVGALLRWS